MTVRGWIVTGWRSTERVTCYMESTPKRSPSRGTMGDYGYGLDLGTALVFPTESKAQWHAARWFGTTGKAVRSIFRNGGAR